MAVYPLWNARARSIERASLPPNFADGQLSKSEYRTSYIELLQVMVDSTYSERGYVWTGKILEKSMTSLVSLYFAEMSMIPPKLRATEGKEAFLGMADDRLQEEPHSLLGETVPCSRAQARVACTHGRGRQHGIRNHLDSR